MGNNETLTAPQPPVDATDMPATAIPMAEEAEASYTYQREDGTVERALNAEDAIARCPVLGKLAVEDPEQANVLLELASAGKDNVAAATHKELGAKPKEKPEVGQKLAETVKSDKETTEPKIEQLTAAVSVTRDSVIIPDVTGQLDRMLADQITVKQASHMAEIHRLMKDQIEELKRPAAEEKSSRRGEPARKAREEVTRRTNRVDNTTRILRVEHGASQPVIVEKQPATDSSGDSRRVDLEEPIKLESIPGNTAHYPLPEDILPVTEETPIAALRPNAQTPTQVPEAVDQDQLEPDGLFDFQELEPSIDEIEPYSSDGQPLEIFYEGEEPSVADEALPHSTGLTEAGALPQHEAIFDNEVIDTSEQLVELVYGELAEIPASGLEQHAELIDDQVIFMDPEAPESIEPNAFEELVASIAELETTPDLDTIMASANEQTLEETLVQLSLYLTETSQDSEQPILQQTLKSLGELLSSSSSDNETEEKKLVITPELTQQLLTLLRAVGYDNPQEVLVAFIKQYNFEFLLQAIRYLSQLCNDDSRQELLHKQATIIALTSDEPLTARLGRAILSLMTRFKVSEVAISD
jgi:hypothetical protein